VVVAGGDGVFVQGPGPDVRDEALPNPGGAPQLEKLLVPPPPVEIADDRNLLGVGGPDGEVRAGRSVALAHMGPQLLVDSVVVPFSQEIEVVVGQKRSYHRRHVPGSLAYLLGWDGQEE